MALYGTQDATYNRQVEAERLSLTAQCVEYYRIDLSGGPVDPLYNEPVPWAFEDANERLSGLQPYHILAVPSFSEVDNKTVDVVQEGKSVLLSGRLKFSRNEWECKTPAGLRPTEGDVVKVSNRYFDVISAKEAGYVNGSAEYVAWQLELAQRSEYTPDRRLP